MRESIKAIEASISKLGSVTSASPEVRKKLEELQKQANANTDRARLLRDNLYYQVASLMVIPLLSHATGEGAEGLRLLGLIRLAAYTTR